MLTYQFYNSDMPLYEQVYRYIKNDIISGVLMPGEKLPSKRSFAHNNGMSTITIQNAYDQLISEGYIFTIPKKGYYVAEIEKIVEAPPKRSLACAIKKPQEPAKFSYDLSSNMVNPDNFPFTIWAKLSRETLSDKCKELMEVSPANGIYALRKAIAEHLKSFRGMCVDPNQVIVGAGTEYLYGLLIQLLGTEKKYCIENPGYKKLVQIYGQYHIDCKFANMDAYGITTAELCRTQADVAHICPNHHFPTGITMPANRRYEVLAWANEEKSRYIIEDDYDSEFRISGKPLPTLFSIDGCEKVIYMNTFSKSLTPTIRISYMILPVHLANQYYDELSFYSCTVSNFEQYTLTAFIQKGYFEKHINRMRLYYSRKRKQLLDCLSHSKLGEICHVKENKSGLHFLIELDTAYSEADIIAKLAQQKIRLQPVSEYYMIPNMESENTYIIKYSNLEMEHIDAVFDRIYELICTDSEGSFSSGIGKK